MNSSKIDVEFLQNLLEGLKTKVNRIKSESKCREFIIVIDWSDFIHLIIL